LFQAGYYVGGAFGLFGWAVLTEFIGWRPSLVVSGVLGVFTALSLIFAVPKDSAEENFLMKWSDLLRVLKNRWLLIISLELFAVTGGTILVTNFIVFYLENALKTPVALAGIVGGIASFSAIPASPIFGRIYDRAKNVRKVLFLSGVGLSLGIAVASIQTLYAALISAVLVGVFNGAAITVGFAAARAAQLPDPRYEALAVSWVNGFSLLPGFWSPIVFSLLVIRFGYTLAWLLASLYTFILISTILVSKGEPH
jgi:predicted MFS family arabinose efflux permease